MDSPLFHLISKEILEEILTAFHICTELPVQIIDEKGDVLLSRGEETKFCRTFQHHLPPQDSCQSTHLMASRRAIPLGEPHIFPCHANLNHIIFPLQHKSTLFGSVLVGPFLLGQADSSLISDLAQSYPLPTPALLELYDLSEELKIISPEKVEQIGKLLYYLLPHQLEADSEKSHNFLSKTPGKQQEMVDKALYYIGIHFAENLSLEDVATEVHLNPTYFSSLFKQNTGNSFREHLNKVRIEESKRLLTSTTQSIVHIATAVGFEDQSYFSKVFKKHTGVTPKQFR